MCWLCCRTPIARLPTIGCREVDLFLLFTRVTALGGWEKVCGPQLSTTSIATLADFEFASQLQLSLNSFSVLHLEIDNFGLGIIGKHMGRSEALQGW